MESRHALAENALKGLIKLFKAIRFYPAEHPALRATVKEVRQAVEQLLAGQKCVSLEIRKEGFLLDGQLVGQENTALSKFAGFLFLRRIHALTLLPGVGEEELIGFVRVIGRDPTSLQESGGAQEALLREGVSNLWVNEVDLESILARREQLQEPPEAAAGDPVASEASEEETSTDTPTEEAPDEKQTLRDLLQELRRTESDRRFGELLEAIAPLVRDRVRAADPLPVLEAFYLLCRCSADRQASRQRRAMVRQLLPKLLDQEAADLLIGLLGHSEVSAERRDRVARVLHYLRSSLVARRLMHHLAVSDEAQSRKNLAQALISLGSVATPVLVEHLQDDRWYVVRNAAVILGELRDPEVTGQLLPLLDHEDLRVRRETIRALTKIGGPEAVEAFLRILAGRDEELRRQALLSLGALKNPAAVPALLRLIRSPDSWVRQAEVLKEAIRALGGIGAPEAAPELITLLRRHKWWRRSLHDQLRATAALALGEIGTPESQSALEEAIEDRSPVVARAAVQGLKQYRRGH